MRIGDTPLMSTIREKCRMCYTCVRDCPAKAIRVSEGQASVVAQRCIGCGNCISVCAQHAKQVYCSLPEVERLLDSGRPAAVLLAPSYPAEFDDLTPEALAGALRGAGFSSVHEVSFGADLVAREYAHLLRTTDRAYIATTCPAVVAYIEKYIPELLDALAPLVSPMVAMARVVKRERGPATAVVFVGPCIAKKGEAVSEGVAGDVDAVLTFPELRDLLARRPPVVGCGAPAPLDGPRGGIGGLFPISRGLLQAAGLQEDLLRGDLIVTEGRANFWAAIRQFRNDPGDVRLLEVLCCHGCVMGPAYSKASPVLERRQRVRKTLQRELSRLDRRAHQEDLQRLSAAVDLRRGFAASDQRIERPSEEKLAEILGRMGKTRREDELDCGACGYNSCRRHATAIYRGLAEVEMCLPYAIESLRKSLRELEESHRDLSEVREALSHSEKLASMGQVAAGIAHEVNNPLGVILLYANMLLERCSAQKDLKEDLTLIVEHSNRCKKIVSGLLNFARQNKVFRQKTDLRALISDALRGAPPPENVRVGLEVEPGSRADVDPDQIQQVLANLISNAYAAMPGGGDLTVRCGGDESALVLEVSDTGTGISKENQAKVFEPFFTTKQVGKGTGLGLAVVHGIVKMHRGQVEVRSNSDPAAGPTGTTFRMVLPRREA